MVGLLLSVVLMGMSVLVFGLWVAREMSHELWLPICQGCFDMQKWVLEFG
jgi:hypothetical protein